MVNTSGIRVADQVWLAVALLHREKPDREAFSSEEIVKRVRQEFGRVSPGTLQHIHAHCVANMEPTAGRYRMLFQPSPGQWRLFRPKDQAHPDRVRAKSVPHRSDIPEKYHELLSWYHREYILLDYILKEDDPLFDLIGIGDSGLSDVSENKHKYLAEILLREHRGGTSGAQ